MYRCKLALIITAAFLTSPNLAAAGTNQDFPYFEKLFSEWTTSFNQKDLKASCALFSLNLSANYQGAAPKNYSTICAGFKKIFQEQRDYKYQFKLHQVYRSQNLAAARISWYLQILEHNKVIAATKDEGLDIFQKDRQGHWKIISYLAYPVK